jgi:hypothetical protein
MGGRRLRCAGWVRFGGEPRMAAEGWGWARWLRLVILVGREPRRRGDAQRGAVGSFRKGPWCRRRNRLFPAAQVLSEQRVVFRRRGKTV